MTYSILAVSSAHGKRGLRHGREGRQFAVIRMADGLLKAVRVVQVWEPGENVNYCGRDCGIYPDRMISLERLCLTQSSSILQVLSIDLEVRVFGLERELEDVRAALDREKEENARFRDKLHGIRQALTLAGTV